MGSRDIVVRRGNSQVFPLIPCYISKVQPPPLPPRLHDKWLRCLFVDHVGDNTGLELSVLNKYIDLDQEL